MKIQDLRLGNLFIDDEGFFSKVIGFAPFDNSTRCDEEQGCYILLDQHLRTNLECESFKCKPIPLTEEWLLKLGFIENSSCFKKGILSFRHYKDIKFIPVIGDYVILNEIKYVHQVQNLVYSLSGEELKATL